MTKKTADNLKLTVILIFALVGPFFLEESEKILIFLGLAAAFLGLSLYYANKNGLKTMRGLIEFVLAFLFLASLFFLLEKNLGFDFFKPVTEKIFQPLSGKSGKEYLPVYCIFASTVILLILEKQFRKLV